MKNTYKKIYRKYTFLAILSIKNMYKKISKKYKNTHEKHDKFDLSKLDFEKYYSIIDIIPIPKISHSMLTGIFQDLCLITCCSGHLESEKPTISESILHIFTNNTEIKILVSTFLNACMWSSWSNLFFLPPEDDWWTDHVPIYSACYWDQMEGDILLANDYMEATNICHVYQMFPGRIPFIQKYRIITIANH